MSTTKNTTMKRVILLLAVTLLLTSSEYSQSPTIKPTNNDADLKRSSLLYDLQALEAKSAKLAQPLAQAVAKAEIADAAWKLDRAWAKKLLRDAYELTFPEETVQTELRNRVAGAPPPIPTDVDRARSDVRNRVFGIAARDKAFADKLIQAGARQMGKYEEQDNYVSLAAKAINEGDKEAASKYILQSIESDPTQTTAVSVILDLAAKDRAAADNLIIQYIERLRTTPLSLGNQSVIRTYFILTSLVFPHLNYKQRQIQSPGPAVMKAYVSYMIEVLSKLEEIEPGSLKQSRQVLLSVWLPLKQCAPELYGEFLELERLSRRPGEDASLPQKSSEEMYKIDYGKRVKEALDSGQPDDSTINFAIRQGDFNDARKMIDMLADGDRKVQFSETVNTGEAISLVTKGDLAGAVRLAERLNKAVSILNVYTMLIGKCAAKKDMSCASTLTYQAMRQLEHADTGPSTLPSGYDLPQSALPTNREIDPVLLCFSKLAISVAPINEILALDVLDEAVRRANKSKMDTGIGRTGFDVDVFRKLSLKNEVRVRQAAESLTDPLRQIVALAAVYQQKAEEVAKETKAAQR